MSGWVEVKTGGISSGLKNSMNSVLNKKMGTSTTYPPNTWPPTVNLMGLLPLKTATKAAICSFNDGADDVPCSSAVCEINPVQAGTGDPSPSNPRAISGFTGLTLTGLGKNMFPSSVTIYDDSYIKDNGDVGSTSNWKCSDYVEVVANATYYFKPNTTSGNVAKHAFYDENHVFISAINSGEISFTTPANCKYMRFSFRSASTDIQLEAGSTATTYEAYKTPTTHSVTWQTEAGTVYGGTLDVVSGVLTVTRTKKLFSELEITKSATGIFYIEPDDLKSLVVDNDVLSDCMLWGGSDRSWLNDKTFAITPWNSTATTRIAIKGDGTETTTTDLMNNIGNFYICYELETHVTYQLTPQEVSTLLGTNNFYHDANGDTQVTYRATSAVLGSKTITANGNYYASADNLDGYSDVSVNVAPNVGTKNITNNGTYNASSDSLDGYSSVTVNVSGGGTTLALHEGKIDSSGNVVTDTDYYYTDEFDCPSGNFMMDFGFTGDQDYTGLRFWTSGGTFIDYWSATSRYRFISNAQYYSEGAKARLSFPKSALSSVLYLDCATNKIISNLDITGLEV